MAEFRPLSEAASRLSHLKVAEIWSQLFAYLVESCVDTVHIDQPPL